MKEPLKVGDRVRVTMVQYPTLGPTLDNCITIETKGMVTRINGKVVQILGDNLKTYFRHLDNCRRLKPKVKVWPQYYSGRLISREHWFGLTQEEFNRLSPKQRKLLELEGRATNVKLTEYIGNTPITGLDKIFIDGSLPRIKYEDAMFLCRIRDESRAILLELQRNRAVIKDAVETLDKIGGYFDCYDCDNNSGFVCEEHLNKKMNHARDCLTRIRAMRQG